MREAIGNTFIVNLILIFLVVISALLVGTISYSKAYKVKNRIIYTIEKYGEWNSNTETELESSLRAIGYPLKTSNRTCKQKTGATLLYGGDYTTNYRYCIYEYTSDRGNYYGVTTFMQFDIPLIGGWLEFPVYGETKVIYSVDHEYLND